MFLHLFIYLRIISYIIFIFVFEMWNLVLVVTEAPIVVVSSWRDDMRVYVEVARSITMAQMLRMAVRRVWALLFWASPLTAVKA